MGLYELLVFVHIAAAVTLLSSSVIASPGLRAAIRHAPTTQDVRAYLVLCRPLLVMEPASAVVVLASGIYLTSVANFWMQGWVQVAVAIWLVNSVVAVVFVKPAITRIAEKVATAEAGPVSPDLDALRRSPRWWFGGDLLMANDAAMLWVMTMRQGHAGALLAVAAALLVVVAVRGLGPSFRRTAQSPAYVIPGKSGSL